MVKPFIYCILLGWSLISGAVHSQTLLILGDSLSAGYQMAAQQSWPTLLPQVMAQQGKSIKVVNASISGDTTGNGLARLPDLLKLHQPQQVLITLGANDGLRGFAPDIIRSNLTEMINLIQQAGGQAMLMQVQAPPNYGKRYSQAFAQVFQQVSEEKQAPLLAFFLEPIILQPDLMMADGLHPKVEAQPIIAEFVAGQLKQYL
ncbi:arylesterase [Motilimonas sp. 1_MG-2023]|uniref:arylesterase n=1 Tax=Motilimonas TaxID=1914248 RepID=UPI0026E34E20|nr:arylesterase [Motilimonas sp. 1_MG-2023]MDO6528050.1 arylesterase [Motilimonas sp. 1_MG-2023]